jgi:hypothetical protein
MWRASWARPGHSHARGPALTEYSVGSPDLNHLRVGKPWILNFSAAFLCTVASSCHHSTARVTNRAIYSAACLAPMCGHATTSGGVAHLGEGGLELVVLQLLRRLGVLGRQRLAVPTPGVTTYAHKRLMMLVAVDQTDQACNIGRDVYRPSHPGPIRAPFPNYGPSPCRRGIPLRSIATAASLRYHYLHAALHCCHVHAVPTASSPGRVELDEDVVVLLDRRVEVVIRKDQHTLLLLNRGG